VSASCGGLTGRPLNLTTVKYRSQLEHPMNPFGLSSDEHNFVRQGMAICQSSNMNISRPHQLSARSLRLITRAGTRTFEVFTGYDIRRHGPGC
jgi:hypothetical protein